MFLVDFYGIWFCIKLPAALISVLSIDNRQSEARFVDYTGILASTNQRCLLLRHRSRCNLENTYWKGQNCSSKLNLVTPRKQPDMFMWQWTLLADLIIVDNFNHCAFNPALLLKLLDIIHEFSVHSVSKQLWLDNLEILQSIPCSKQDQRKQAAQDCVQLVWISWRIEEPIKLLGNLFHCLSSLTVGFSFLVVSRVYCISVHAHCSSTCHQAPPRWVWLIFQESWSRIDLMTPSQWQCVITPLSTWYCFYSCQAVRSSRAVNSNVQASISLLTCEYNQLHLPLSSSLFALLRNGFNRFWFWTLAFCLSFLY